MPKLKTHKGTKKVLNALISSSFCINSKTLSQIFETVSILLSISYIFFTFISNYLYSNF
mgnify:CR=1 FL=1